jgi:hypothetical protein
MPKGHEFGQPKEISTQRSKKLVLAFEVNSATPNYDETQTYCYFKIRISYQLIDLSVGVVVKKVQGVSCDRCVRCGRWVWGMR